MKIKNVILSILSALAAMWFSGCELNSNSQDPTSTETPTTTTTTTTTTPTTTPTTTTATPPVGSADDLDISGAKDYGNHAGTPAKSAAITKMLFSANVSGGSVNLSFETLNWPAEGGSKKIDGGVYIYWVDGSGVIGGYFDGHGVGQTSKGLENIHGGYLNGHRPAKGTTVYFTLVSLDGRQRTNVKRSSTPW